MAVFNEILVGRYSRYLQKLFGTKGGPPTPSLSGDLFPILNITDTPLEDRYLVGVDHYHLLLTQGAVAAQNTVIRVRNPVSSNVVAIIESCYMQENTADTTFQVGLSQQTTDFSNILTLSNAFVDSRGSRSPTLIGSGGNNIGSLSLPRFQFSMAVNQTTAEMIQNPHQEIPLLPGWAMTWFTGAVNTILWVSLGWRERFLDDSERA